MEECILISCHRFPCFCFWLSSACVFCPYSALAVDWVVSFLRRFLCVSSPRGPSHGSVYFCRLFFHVPGNKRNTESHSHYSHHPEEAFTAGRTETAPSSPGVTPRHPSDPSLKQNFTFNLYIYIN